MRREKPCFPVQDRWVYLSHCGVSPLYPGAFLREKTIAEAHVEGGAQAFRDYGLILERLRSSASLLLRTAPENLSFMKNTSEALGLVAYGYPLEPGDEIISYVHEYPANHYPWRLQEERGAVLRLLPNRGPAEQEGDERPYRWFLSDLEALFSSRTRIVALSHVQFTSGFAADLEEVAGLCRAHKVDLVLDAAQSLGALPLYPDQLGVAALAASGWKWLMGPVGTGLLYTSPDFRRRLRHVMVGAELMEQGQDYLDHAWRPFTSGKRFEYSTSPVSLAAGLEASISEVILPWGPDAIRDELFRLQNLLIEGLDPSMFTPIVFPARHRSGILSVRSNGNASALVLQLEREGIIVSERAGYVRLAPHYYNTPDEMARTIAAMNRAGFAR